MVPSFVTTEPILQKHGEWCVVRKDFHQIHGQAILSQVESTILPPSYPNQPAAERAAGLFAEANRIRHIPSGKAIITLVLLGEKIKQQFVPIMLNAEGSITLQGDGLASPFGIAMAKAAQIAKEKGLISTPPTEMKSSS